MKEAVYNILDEDFRLMWKWDPISTLSVSMQNANRGWKFALIGVPHAEWWRHF